MNGVKTTAALGCATVLAFGLAGCGASFEGSGSKDAASAEQIGRASCRERVFRAV